MPMEGNWKRGKLLGTGAFGQVYVAMMSETGAEFAVKQVGLHPESGCDNIREAQALEDEIQLLKVRGPMERTKTRAGSRADFSHGRVLPRA